MAKQIKKTTKAAVKKTTVKKAVVAAPVAEHKCDCGCGAECACHKHCHAHLLKRIVILAIVFALGMVCGKMIPCGHHPKDIKFPIQQQHPVFTNGCLDVNTVQSPKMREELGKADVNGDKCISLEEYKAVRKAMKPQRPGAMRQQAPDAVKAFQERMKGGKK